MLPWDEFSEFFLEEYTLKQNRKWEELYATDQELDGYEGKSVVINYTYGDGGGHTTVIHWSFALDENKTIRTVSYTGSSSFAFWWCNFTDELEEEDDQYKTTCGNKCGTVLDIDEHIHCLSKGDEEAVWCDVCFQDLWYQMKKDGWKHDEDEEEENE